MLEAFRVADTGRLQEVHDRRPSHYSRPMPFAYLDILSEAARHSAGIRYRTMTPSVVFVFQPDIQVEVIDAMVDDFADHLSSYAHVVPNTVWDTWTATEEGEDIESNEGSIRTLPTVRFTLGNYESGKGRS